MVDVCIKVRINRMINQLIKKINSKKQYTYFTDV